MIVGISRLFLAKPTKQVCPTAIWNSSLSIIAGGLSTSSTNLMHLRTPMNIFFNGYGYLYVVDNGLHRIQVFPPGRY